MKNKYPPLVKTNHEPEYKTSPPLKISSVGTEIKKNSSVIPDGSALLTNTGNNSSLKTQGIDYIVHAVPKMRSGCSSDEEFIEIAVKAAQNSIILADREGIKSLAICFIGGEIYRGTCDPQKLAEGIILGVINQIEKVNDLETISLIDWKGNSRHYLLEKTIELWKVGELPVLSWDGDETIFDALTFNPKGSRNIVVRAGNICDKNTHGASAVVNSENAGMSWGGGISGAIKGALGTEASNVDQQRKGLMNKFNELIIKNDDKDNKSVLEWQKELKKQSKLGRVEEVKKLLEGVKNNSQFLNLIKTKQNSDNLGKLISDKTPSEVIQLIKRFEFDNLSQLDKEIKIKKIRKYYNLGENDTLPDSKINEYCYKVAVGQINENNERSPNPENNILKYLSIGSLTLIPLGLLLAFFIRKRKKFNNRI